MNIPMPTETFEQWVDILRGQESRIPVAHEDWQSWVGELYKSTSNFFFVNPLYFSRWNDWAWEFLKANQGR